MRRFRKRSRKCLTEQIRYLSAASHRFGGCCWACTGWASGPEPGTGVSGERGEDQAASEQRLVRVTQFLDVTVHAEERDALGVTEDLLIGTDVRFNALVVRAPEAPEVRWQIP